LSPKHVIDTCCFINFFASGRAHSLLQSVGCPIAIPEAVKREMLYIAAPHPDENATRVEIGQVISELKLTVASPANDRELALYVELAADLDDGEAMGLALAKARDLVLLTDERKARKKAASLEVQVLTTPDVVAAWEPAVTKVEVIEVIQCISRYARYSPGSGEARYDWWMQRLCGA